MKGLRVPKPKAPQYALLEGATPQQEYQQFAGPRLGPEAKGEKSGALIRAIVGVPESTKFIT